MPDSEPLQAKITFSPRSGLLDTRFLPELTAAESEHTIEHWNLTYWGISILPHDPRPCRVWLVRLSKLQPHHRQILEGLIGSEIAQIAQGGTFYTEDNNTIITLSSETSAAVRAAWQRLYQRPT